MRFKGQKIAVTGGAGEIGARIVTRLLAEGAEVSVLDRVPPTSPGPRSRSSFRSTVRSMPQPPRS